MGEETEMNSLIIQLREFIAIYPGLLSVDHKQRLQVLVVSLSDEVVQSVF